MSALTDREPPGWFRLSAKHFDQLLAALESPALQRAMRMSDPRGEPELVERIVEAIGDALARYGFDAANEPTTAGKLLEDLIDYFVPHHPNYSD